MYRPHSLIVTSLRGLAYIGGLVLVGMMLINTVDVTLRSIAGTGIVGAQEFTELGLVLVFVLGLAYCGLTGGHISLDLMNNILPKRFLRVSGIIIRLLSFAVVSVVAWYSFEEGLRAFARGAATNVLDIAQYPFYWIVGLSFAAYAFVLLIQALRTDIDSENSDSHS